jgi:hypothetical protein
MHTAHTIGVIKCRLVPVTAKQIINNILYQTLAIQCIRHYQIHNIKYWWYDAKFVDDQGIRVLVPVG